MSWSVKKLDSFYQTSIGLHIKQMLQAEINKVIDKYHADNLLICGYNIMDSDCDHMEKAGSLTRKYDCIIACHCDDMGFCMNEFTLFCNQHLKEKGICILIAPNGSGFWSHCNTPFQKHKANKNIKMLKRSHFSIIVKKPILCYPTKLIQTGFKNTYPMWNFVMKYAYPRSAGGFIVVAKKQAIVEKRKTSLLNKLSLFADVNHAYNKYQESLRNRVVDKARCNR